jgi:hypothetical protein
MRITYITYAKYTKICAKYTKIYAKYTFAQNAHITEGVAAVFYSNGHEVRSVCINRITHKHPFHSPEPKLESARIHLNM